jgi:hypothetical protein
MSKPLRPVAWPLALLALLLTLTVRTGPAAAQDEGTSVYKMLLKSTVFLLVPAQDGVSMGSGALVDAKNRIIITNFHVVGTAPEVAAMFPLYQKGNSLPVAEQETYQKLFQQGKVTIGKVVARHIQADLALVQLPKLPEGVRPLALSKEGAAPGMRVHSLGNPVGASGGMWVYTSGTVRTVYRGRRAFKLDEMAEPLVVDTKWVETQSPTNSGDSGGPLVNDRCELVAVTQGGRSSEVANLISYFIDVSEVKGLLDRNNLRGYVIAGSSTASTPPKPAGGGGGEGTAGGNAAAPAPSADEEARRVARELTTAIGNRQEELLEKLRSEKGGSYTVALAEVIPSLGGTMQSRAREALIERLMRMTPKTLQGYLQYKDVELRRAAAIAAGRKEPKEVAAKDLANDLITLLSDADRDVSYEAYQSLKKLSGKDFGKTPSKWKDWAAKQR